MAAQGIIRQVHTHLSWDEYENKVTIQRRAIETPEEGGKIQTVKLSYDGARELFYALAFLFRPFTPADFPEVH